MLQLCTEEIEKRMPNAALAHLLRASFYLIRGEAVKAADDFDKLLALPDVDKRVSTFLVGEEPNTGFETKR